jgi:predicted N-acetyltransferase YhbS
MNITNRPYLLAADFERVSQFLITHHQPLSAEGNWLQPAWEYMHFHSLLDVDNLHRIRLWEAEGEIVAVAHYEWHLGEAFFQFHPDFAFLKRELLDYAEAHLRDVNEQGEPYLCAFVHDFDLQLEALVRERGYQLRDEWSRPLSFFTIPDPFPPITLPEGFRLQSLADENDLGKIHRVLWRGFDHPGEPPEEDIASRKLMQSGPNFRHDLTIVAVAPDGAYVAFSGTWHEKANHLAYVEPVATDPTYRRMGLGKAAVLEGIRRCALQGATVAYVGSNQAFYQALGFRQAFVSRCWEKIF